MRQTSSAPNILRAEKKKQEAGAGSSPSLTSLPSPLKKVTSDIKMPKTPSDAILDIPRQDFDGQTGEEDLQIFPSWSAAA